MCFVVIWGMFCSSGCKVYGEMKHTVNLLISVFLLSSGISCSRYPAGVEQSLRLAGDNRAELEKALEHYSEDPADSKPSSLIKINT